MGYHYSMLAMRATTTYQHSNIILTNRPAPLNLYPTEEMKRNMSRRPPGLTLNIVPKINYTLDIISPTGFTIPLPAPAPPSTLPRAPTRINDKIVLGSEQDALDTTNYSKYNITRVLTIMNKTFNPPE